MHRSEKLKLHMLGMAVFTVFLSAPSVTFASACDEPGECKGVVETYTPPAPTSQPQSATGCFIPGRTNCRMESGSCVCDPAAPAEEETGYLCMTSDPCKTAEVIVVNGHKECLITLIPNCMETAAPDPVKDGPDTTLNEADPTPDALEVPSTTPPSGEPAVDPALESPPTLPPPPLVNIPADEWCKDLPAELQDCCRKAGGSPVDVMKECVDRDTPANRDSGCNIVIHVLGDFTLGDKAQMNLCCQVVNNSGTISDSAIVQECENAFDGMPVETSTPSEPAATPDDTTSTDDCADGIIVLGKCQPKDFVHLQGGGDGSGCTLTAGASGLSDMSWLSLMLLGASLLGLKRFRTNA